MNIATKQPGQKRTKTPKLAKQASELPSAPLTKHPLEDVIGSLSSSTWLEIVEEQEQERQRQRILREQEESAQA